MNTWQMLQMAREARDIGRHAEAEQLFAECAPDFEHRRGSRPSFSRSADAIERDIRRHGGARSHSDRWAAMMEAAERMYRLPSPQIMWMNPETYARYHRALNPRLRVGGPLSRALSESL